MAGRVSAYMHIFKLCQTSNIGLQGMARRFFTTQIFEEKTFAMKNNKILIHVKKGNITNMDVDAIVNAANENMAHGGGVAACIAKSGGPQLKEECREYIKNNGKVEVTNLCKTTGGNMPCVWVYHAVGPRWRSYKEQEKEKCRHDLCETILRCLKQSEKDRCRSLAIPSISSGIFGVPKDDCADMYVKAVERFDCEHRVSHLSDVYFVDIDTKMLDKIKEKFEKNLDVNTKSP